MIAKDDLHRPKFFGSTVVSPRGQVVIPANARKELGIPGEAFVVGKIARLSPGKGHQPALLAELGRP